MQKQIYEITVEDINKYPVWHFPMDESVYDEQTVKPYEGDTNYTFDERIIVRTYFKDKNNKEYVGYIYWSTPEDIGYIQPALFANNSLCVTFWEGANTADWDGYGENTTLIKDMFPISFKSEEFSGISSIEGVLEGLYYINNNDETVCVKP